MIMYIKLADSGCPVHGLYVSKSSPVPLQHLVQSMKIVVLCYRINDL